MKQPKDRPTLVPPGIQKNVQNREESEEIPERGKNENLKDPLKEEEEEERPALLLQSTPCVESP